MKTRLIVATRNAKKLKEIKDILKGLPLEISSLEDHARLPRIVENGASFAENAAKKAVPIAAATGSLCLGEDSGLCVDALDGGPGIYSARFAGKQKSDEKNNRKLLRLLRGMPPGERKAHYVCAVALADKHGLIAVVQGRCDGRIGTVPRGRSGFGYDPLFVIPKYKKTFAQLGLRIKHGMSHRFRALKKARVLLARHAKKAPPREVF
jgi:XTP/dITP diphosphohydrolase